MDLDFQTCKQKLKENLPVWTTIESHLPDRETILDESLKNLKNLVEDLLAKLENENQEQKSDIINHSDNLVVAMIN